MTSYQHWCICISTHEQPRQKKILMPQTPATMEKNSSRSSSNPKGTKDKERAPSAPTDPTPPTTANNLKKKQCHKGG